ncbi:hypothetical protein [Rubrivirga sp.]|uniref:hypothetical protein n=1 Tax=Rubrivirga sp. TaxID=1885344 RepID=UPI003C78F58D
MLHRPLLLLAAFALFTTGCDSGGSDSALERIQGRYSLDALSFDPSTPALPEADVGARLDANDTELQVFGDGDAQIIVFPAGGGRSSLISLRVEANSRRATFEAVTENDRDDLDQLLLPSEFSLDYEGERPTVLEGQLNLTGIDLESFDPDTYRDQRSNRGTLLVRFRRP